MKNIKIEREILPLLLIYFSLSFYLLYKYSFFPNFHCPNPTMDTDFYLLLIKLKKIHSPIIEKYPYFYSPLFANYLYFLSLIWDNLVFYRIINIIIGSLIPLGFWILGKELFNSKRYSVILVLISIFYDGFIFYSIQISKVTLGLVLILWGIIFFIKFFSYKRDIYLIVSGSLLSFSSLIYGGIIFFIVVSSLLLIKKFNLKKILFFLFPFFILVIFILYRNYNACKDIVFFSAVDGIHFLIGNNPKSRGLYVRIKGIRPNAFGHYFDGIKLVEDKLGKKVTPSEASKFYKKLAIKWIKNNPQKALKLYCRKLLLIFNHYDFPNNIDIHYFKKNILFFRYVTISYWIILCLGISGVIFINFKDERELILFIFFLSYLFSLLTYFISDRYRMPLVFSLIYFSILFLKNIFKNLYIKKKIVSILLLILFIFISHLNLDIPKERVKYLTKKRMEHSKIICKLKKQIAKTKDKNKRNLLCKQLANFYLKIGGKEWFEFYKVNNCSLF